MARVKFALSLLCCTIALSLLGSEIAAAGQEPAPSVVPLDVEFGKPPAPVEAIRPRPSSLRDAIDQPFGRMIVLTEIDVFRSARRCRLPFCQPRAARIPPLVEKSGRS